MSATDRGRKREPRSDGRAVVEVDAEAGRLEVDLSEDEIAARLAAVEHPPPRYPTGVLAKYARLVGSAATGARVGA